MALIEWLGTNRGFELGDFTQWTVYESASNGTQSVINTDPYEGTYHAQSMVYYQKTDEPHQNSANNQFTTGFIPVFPGKNYFYSFWAKQYANGHSGGYTHTNALTLRLSFYDSSNVLVGAEVVLVTLSGNNTASPLGADYQLVGDYYVTPAGVASVKMQIRHLISGWATGTSGSWGIYFDKASIASQAPAAGGLVYLSDYGVV